MFCPHCNAYNTEDSIICSECGMPLLEIKQKKKVPIVLISIIIGSVLASICLVIGVMAINNSKNQKKYDKKIVAAEKYIREGNYELAIEAYNEAIKIDDEDEDAYIQLATAYYEMGNMEKVDEILTKGYQKTKGKRINLVLRNYLAFGNLEGVEAVTVTDDDAIEKNSEVYLDNDLLELIADYGYQDYESMYGPGTINRENGNDLISISYTNPGIKIFYANNQSNTFDSSTGIPIGNTKPSYIVVDNFGVLFEEFDSNITYEDLCDMFNANLEVLSNSNGYYIEANYMACKIQLGCDAGGNITSDNTWNMIVENGAGENNLEATFDGVASGKIIDAVTGYGIPEVSLTVREGANNQYGEVIEKIKSDMQGNYILELNEGRYTICAEADGFTTEFFEVNVVKGMTLTAQNLTMSSTLNSGEVRIVLEWGAYPTDLDAHLRTSRGEVDFRNMSISGVAGLDVDDRNGYGPETITIDNVTAGEYTYYVEDYTNLGYSSSNELANSGATVKVYMPGESEPRIFKVPSGTGTEWEVFSLRNGNIEEINRITTY